MTWFKRTEDGIQTKTIEKRETPDGIWTQCNGCKKAVSTREMELALYVCPECDYHVRIGAPEYFDILFDDGAYDLLFDEIFSKDVLKFVDLKTYRDRLRAAWLKTGLNDAAHVARGLLSERELVMVAMDFRFIGGSMGSVVGERISRAIDVCLQEELPLVILSKSGGARMMESAFSLMQMAKTAAQLTRLADARLPYISVLTDPTTGGVTASFSMLGDVIIAEPKALIGFAGPRVIKETIKRDLPEGFQRSEFLQEQGFLDCIVHRQDLKAELAKFVSFMMP